MARGWGRAAGRATRQRIRQLGLFTASALVLLLGLVITAGLWIGLTRWLNHHWPWYGPLARGERRTSNIDLTKLALAVVAGVGAAIGLTVTYRRQRDLERGRFDERFAAAAGQLGADTAAQRLAGVYAVGALADENEARRQQCIDLLCAYIRLPYDPAAGLLRTVVSEHSWPVGSATGKEQRTYERLPNDRDVRLAIIALIAGHLRPEAKTSWSKYNYDFSSALLDGGDFSRARFSGAVVRFDGATFSGGGVRFDAAEFSDGLVDFDAAEFSGRLVDFNGATFSGAVVRFGGARFSGAVVRFNGATFSGGGVHFDGARFSGAVVDFNWARFSGAVVLFDGAEFSSGEVDFNGARFSDGLVHFNGATFSGAGVDFGGAEFSSGEVDFNGATFSGGLVRFDEATFSGAEVHFGWARFSGGLVHFNGATFSGGVVRFDRATFSGGVVRFDEATFSGGQVTRDGADFRGYEPLEAL